MMRETKKCLILSLLERSICLFLIFFWVKYIFLNQGAGAMKLYQYTEKT